MFLLEVYLCTETSNVVSKGKGKRKKSNNFFFKQTWRVLNTRRNGCRDKNVALHFFQRRRCLKKNLPNKVTYAGLYVYLSFHGDCPINWIITYTYSIIDLFP